MVQTTFPFMNTTWNSPFTPGFTGPLFNWQNMLPPQNFWPAQPWNQAPHWFNSPSAPFPAPWFIPQSNVPFGVYPTPFGQSRQGFGVPNWFNAAPGFESGFNWTMPFAQFTSFWNNASAPWLNQFSSPGWNNTIPFGMSHFPGMPMGYHPVGWSLPYNWMAPMNGVPGVTPQTFNPGMNSAFPAWTYGQAHSPLPGQYPVQTAIPGSQPFPGAYPTNWANPAHGAPFQGGPIPMNAHPGMNPTYPLSGYPAGQVCREAA